MTYKKTTRKSSSTPGSSRRKRQPHHNRRTNDNDDDDSTGVVQSDESANDIESDVKPQNDDDYDSYADSGFSPTNSFNDRFSSPSKRTNDINKVPQTQTTSYVPIAPFPIFRGGLDECPVAHLSRFSKVCRANNVWPGSAPKIFPVTLEGEALLWYDLNIDPYGQQLTWEDIKSSFSQAYRATEPAEKLRSELTTIRQRDEESVRSYFLRLQWLLRELPEHGLSDGDLKGVFVRGLSGDLRDRVVAKKPGSLSEAMRLAFGFEQANTTTVRRNASAVKCGFCDGSHEEKGCEARERMRGLWLRSRAEGKGVAVALAKDFRRSVSMAASADKAKGQSQCQCWKHQCWRRNLDRNFSNVSGNFKA